MSVLRPRLGFPRYVELIEHGARLFAEDLVDADPTVRVPSCPDWNLAQLTQHVGEELRWVAGMVRSRATAMADDTAMRRLDPHPVRDGAATGAWIVAGARELCAALSGAGPGTAMWTPVPGEDIAFMARRFAHETAVHRADATQALGRSFAMESDAALDALAEWMELGALPMMDEYHPHRRALLGPGRTVRWEAVDAAGPDATWFVDLTGPAPVHRPGTAEPAAVSARGPLLDVLLVLYRRRGVDALEVTGDRVLLDEWRARHEFA